MKRIIYSQNGEAIYVGNKPNDTDTQLVIPKSIERIGLSLVRANTGEHFRIGLTFMHSRLDVEKLGLDPSLQPLLSQIVAKAACQYNLLPHMQYKKSKYGTQNANGTFPKDFFVSYGNYSFRSRPDVILAEAIMSLFEPSEEIFVSECSIAIQVICYKALLEFLGSTKFNQLFAETGLVIEQKPTSSHPLFNLRSIVSMDWQNIAEDPTHILNNAQIGDLLYIANIAPYALRHPTGNSLGINVIKVGTNNDGKYLLAGLFTDKKIHHYDEIVDHLVEDYNKVPFEANFIL